MREPSIYPHIHVTCAIIEQNGHILAAQRSATMSLPLKWEFPGGKINPGESREACLQRELHEEMGLTIAVGTPLSPYTHSYDTFTVTLYPFRCSILSGKIQLYEHAAITWLLPEALSTLDWAEADWPIIEQFLEIRSREGV